MWWFFFYYLIIQQCVFIGMHDARQRFYIFFSKNVMYQVLWISVQINKLQVYSPTMISFPYAFLHKLYSRHNVFLWLCCNEKLKYFRLSSSYYSWSMKSLLCWELGPTCMQLIFFCPSCSNQQLCLI